MMKKNLLMGTALGLTLGASAVSAEPVIAEASAEPLVLNDAQLDGVTAGFFFGSFSDFLPVFEFTRDNGFLSFCFLCGSANPFPD